jgi:hypothetical protein
MLRLRPRHDLIARRQEAAVARRPLEIPNAIRMDGLGNCLG